MAGRPIRCRQWLMESEERCSSNSVRSALIQNASDAILCCSHLLRCRSDCADRMRNGLAAEGMTSLCRHARTRNYCLCGPLCIVNCYSHTLWPSAQWYGTGRGRNRARRAKVIAKTLVVMTKLVQDHWCWLWLSPKTGVLIKRCAAFASAVRRSAPFVFLSAADRRYQSVKEGLVVASYWQLVCQPHMKALARRYLSLKQTWPFV